MKKVILTLALLMGVAAAQAESLEASKFTDNWSITLKGGGVAPFQRYAVFKNARGIFGAEIRKQITPIFGLGVEGEWTINTTSWNDPRSWWGPKNHNIIDHQQVGMFGAFNLSNLFGGYKGAPRFFELEALYGAGWFHAYHGSESANYYGNDYNSWYTKAGLNLNFNVGASKALTISVKPSIMWDMNGDINDDYATGLAEWNVYGPGTGVGAAGTYANTGLYNDNGKYFYNWQKGEPRNDKSRCNADHAWLQLELGLTYHFKNSNGYRYFTFCPYKYSQADIDALNGQINDWRNKANSLQGDLDAANARNAQLQRDLDACRNQKPVVENTVVDKSKEYLKILVHFLVNKTNITKDQQPNVERVASYMKNHPNSTVTIQGYASPEGPKDNNIRLANGRAEAVKNMLIKKYGIDASRIDAKGCGETDMFEELSWNRVSICEIIVNENK